MHHALINLAPQSNLLVARLQRTAPFCAGAPALFDLPPLMAEADEWLRTVDRTWRDIPAPDLLPVLDNYDLLHRIVRRTPGTPLLQQAYSHLLTGSKESTGGEEFEFLAIPAEINSYILDAFYKLKALSPSSVSSPCSDCSVLVLEAWSSALSNPLSPLPPKPELIARLRLLLEHPVESSPRVGERQRSVPPSARFASSKEPHRSMDLCSSAPLRDKINARQSLTTDNSTTDNFIMHSALSIMHHELTHPSSTPTLQALLTFTIRLKSQLSQYINVDHTIQSLQQALATAPDNHPLDRAARHQLLDNARAFASPQSIKQNA